MVTEATLFMQEKVEQKKRPDRKLGDEWEDWEGDLDESHSYKESPGLFAGIAVLTTALFSAGLLFVLYMIEPRLTEIHPLLLMAVSIMVWATILFLAGWIALLIISAFTVRNFVVHRSLGQVSATKILPWTLTLAKKIGISRDRLGNSFIFFANAIVRATHKPGEGKTIILLPRCLKKEMKEEVKELADRAGVEVFTATGGGQARQIIREHHPSAVIGVACERDLMSGISDVAPHMPTIGVANKRPEGPCKNTVIDLDELKDALATLTGVTFEK